MNFSFFAKKPGWHGLGLLALLAAALFAWSCSHPPPPKYYTQFYIEATKDAGLPFTLPVSGLTYRRMPEPFLTLSDVVRVEEGEVNVSTPGLGETQDKRLCVIFQLGSEGTRILYSNTAANLGKRIFLFVNDKPMAVRLIDRPMDGGTLYVFAEIADKKELDDFVFDLQDSIKAFAKMKKDS